LTFTHIVMASCSGVLSGVRKFSSSAMRSKLVSAPIQLFGTEGRYAHALYSAATKQESLAAVEAELAGFQATAASDTPLREFLRNPSVKRVHKIDAVKDVAAKQQLSPVTTNFLASLAENGRMGQMADIIGAFNKLMSAHRGEVVCSVTTAKPLEADEQAELEGALHAFLQAGQVLQLSTSVDPALIGGMVVNIGDKFVDMSMATKIKAYSALITEAV